MLSNYRSIAGCDVPLGPLTFLVGANGSGKSNFLDALRFVAESLQTSLDHALRDRGGINEVRRRSSGHPNHFGCRLEMSVAEKVSASFAFRIGAQQKGRFVVQEERCEILDFEQGIRDFYCVVEGRLTASSLKVAPPALEDRLYLVNAAGVPEFRPLYDRLSRMGFYNLNPEAIRDLQQPDPGQLLKRDGGNLASVLDSLASQAPDVKARIEEFLSRVVPGITGVAARPVGHKETIEFRQEVAGASHAWRFPAANMSDGTLRAFAVLVALFQSMREPADPVPLVGIEEPEVALHPAAAGVLRDALFEASRFTQVLVTSHSPELLDDESIDTDSILAVVAREGNTEIGPLDAAGRSVLRDHLYTAGELLRLDQLTPDPEAVRNGREAQGQLFRETQAA